MKRTVAFLLVVCVLLACCGCAGHRCESSCESCGLCLNTDCQESACAGKCQGHHTCANTCPDCGLCTNAECTDVVCTQKCQGHHTCGAPCPDCGLCINADCTDAVCAEKCPGHKEEPHVFSSGDYITDKAVSIDTGTFVYDIGPGVYVKGDLQEITDAIVPLIEQFMNLDFDGAGYARRTYRDGKIHINVTRDFLYAGEDWYHGSPDSEAGLGYADPLNHVRAAPVFLYLGNSAIVHEASHVMMYRNSEWEQCELLAESLSTYTTYLIERELEKTNAQIGFYIGTCAQSLLDMEIDDYDKLYGQPLEYWLENDFDYAGNGNYAIGFRFAAYLHAVYGDYAKWVTQHEKMYPFKKHSGDSDQAFVEQMVKALKAAYGEDVLDNFYPWLKEHHTELDPVYDDWGGRNHIYEYDLTAAGGINLYPSFNALESRIYLKHIRYQDLYINLETARTYLTEYKKKDATGLTLHTTQPITVNLYQADGSFTTVTTEEPVSLEGISYIKLVGEGYLEFLEVKGPFRYYFLDEEYPQ